MNDAIIKPSAFDLPPVAETVFLFFALNHFFLFRDLTHGSKVRSFGPAKRFSFEKSGTRYTALGGIIGAPIAVIVAENAISSGAKFIQSFGTAGHLRGQPQCIGDLLVPKSGKDETGMIRDYGGDDELTVFNRQSDWPACNTIVSVNSFYRLTSSKVLKYRKEEIDLIDMEAAPLNHVITLRGGCFRPHFIISDLIDTHFSWRNGIAEPKFQDGLDTGLTRLYSSL